MRFIDFFCKNIKGLSIKNKGVQLKRAAHFFMPEQRLAHSFPMMERRLSCSISCSLWEYMFSRKRYGSVL